HGCDRHDRLPVRPVRRDDTGSRADPLSGRSARVAAGGPLAVRSAAGSLARPDWSLSSTGRTRRFAALLSAARPAGAIPNPATVLYPAVSWSRPLLPGATLGQSAPAAGADLLLSSAS